MNTKNLIQQIGIATLCVLFSSQALSFQTLKCNGISKKWPNNYYQINANPTGFGGNYTHWYNSFNASIARFNQNPSKFYMSMQMDNDTAVGVDNGESELWWATTGCSATAYTINDTCGITVEGDIHFSNVPDCVLYEDDMSDKSVFRNYGSGIMRTFETTAIHEIGHTAGLAHENGEYNIMGSDYSHVHANGAALRSYVGEDGGDGLVWLYGARTNTIQDVSAAAWKKVGVSGEYSTHGRTELFNSSGTALASVNADGCIIQDKVAHCQQLYTVDMGQVVQYEVNLENNGNSTQTVNVGYYISTNDSITNQDTLLASESRTLSRANVDVFKKTLTIPTNLTANTNYFLGVIVDYDNALSEISEDNNASYMHIRTSAAGGSSSGGSSSGGSSSGGSSSGGSSSSSGGALNNGQAVTGISGTTSSDANYYIDVPSGATNLVISIAAGSGATGDADMYVKKDSVPTDNSYDCRPYLGGNAETCGGSGSALTTSVGRFYIRLKAYSNFTNVVLTATYTAGGGSSSGGSSSGGSSSGGSSSGGSVTDACATEGTHTGSSVTASDTICLPNGTSSGSIQYKYINVPANTSSLTIRTAHGTGNGNLYYNAANWATSSAYTQSSTNSGNTETITVNNPASGYRFFSVTGIQSGMSLIAEVQ